PMVNGEVCGAAPGRAASRLDAGRRARQSRHIRHQLDAGAAERSGVRADLSAGATILRATVVLTGLAAFMMSLATSHFQRAVS
ncbi:MAG TPA: hypothetical protein VIH21_01320, partial [Dehalococcoidia bacterium]